MPKPEFAIFDLDGTLLDSDEPLVQAFVSLGIAREQLSFGHAIEPECERLGISIDDYVAAYDTTAAVTFDGADEVVTSLDSWAICSNKHTVSGIAELQRLGWTPKRAYFSGDFDGQPKSLAPLLDVLDLHASQVLFVGDTEHDELCASVAGCAFAWAAWNPRTRAFLDCESSADRYGDVAYHPRDVLEMLS